MGHRRFVCAPVAAHHSHAAPNRVRAGAKPSQFGQPPLRASANNSPIACASLASKKKRESRTMTDTVKRCAWAGTTKPLMIEYHDKEWGRPVHDDRTLFEFLILEGAQAGLSWETILNKRENYRKAFNNFDARKIARYNKAKEKTLLKNPGIVRNRLKVSSAVSNAQAFLAVQKEFGSFDKYIWQFVGGEPRRNALKSQKEIQARTVESDAMSKDLKKRGFRFVGTTICYAFMQAVGMVNDHMADCEFAK
jgi:DNA-3-methyladenine glycosylase I